MSDAEAGGALAKKKSLVASEQGEERIQDLRRRFIAYAKTLDPRRLVFLDESGSHVAMTREYAWTPVGERAVDMVPRNRGTVTTMLGAMDCQGVRALMTVEGATDADVFEVFVKDVLVPKLKAEDIVVMDNVGAHKPEGILALIRASGARVLFLPPYSPDLNPIELLWARFKQVLKDFGARTREALEEAISNAIDFIGPGDARGWFSHCGYDVQAK